MQNCSKTMTKQKLYDEALRHMGQAPLEQDEAQPPKSAGGRPKGQRNKPGHNAGRPSIGDGPAVHRSVLLAPDLIPLIAGHAKARGQSFNLSINQLLGEVVRQHEWDAETGELL